METNYRNTKQLTLRIAVLLLVFVVLIANVLGLYYVDLDLGLKVEASAFGFSANSFLQTISKSIFIYDIVKIIPACILLCIVLPLLNPVKASIATLVVSAYTLSISLNSIDQDSHLLLEFGLLSVAIIFSVHVLSSFFTEHHEKQKLNRIFSQYIPPELVQAYNASSYIKNLKGDLEGVSRELSVMFCDIQKFTTLSDGMEPKRLAKLLNAFLTDVTHIVLKHNGTIDKYMGDAVMAFWGAPVPDADHADHAYNAAVDIQKQMRILRTKFVAMELPEIYCGIGVNTGVCSVGNMGSEFRIAYTAIGDVVNVASRLERLTRRYRVPIVIGEATVAKLSNVVCRELDIVKVKGHSRYIKVYDPLKVANIEQAELHNELAIYHQGLLHYRKQEWDQAWKIFNDLHGQHPQVHLYKLYKESIHYYEHHPPGENWFEMIADSNLIDDS